MKSIFKLALSLAIMASAYNAQADQLVNDALLAAIKSDDVEKVETVIQDAGGLDQCINYTNANRRLVHTDNQDTLEPNRCSAEAFLIEALCNTKNTETIEYILETYQPRLNFYVHDNSWGHTVDRIPLGCAQTIEIVELLLEAGANTNYIGHDQWFLQLLIYKENTKNNTFIRMLLRHGTNIAANILIDAFPKELQRLIITRTKGGTATDINEIFDGRCSASTRIMLLGYARAWGIDRLAQGLDIAFMEKLAQFLTQKYKPEIPFTVEDVDSFIENEAKIFRSGICKTGSLERIAKARELGISVNDPILDLV